MPPRTRTMNKGWGSFEKLGPVMDQLPGWELLRRVLNSQEPPAKPSPGDCTRSGEEQKSQEKLGTLQGGLLLQQVLPIPLSQCWVPGALWH